MFKEELRKLESQSRAYNKTSEDIIPAPDETKRELYSRSNVEHIVDVSSEQAPPSDFPDTPIHSMNEATLNDLRCYIRFAEDQLLPQYWLFHQGNTPNGSKIRFDDLWYLFRPGDFIYIPPRTLVKATETEQKEFSVQTGRNTLHQSWMQQKVWRLCYTQTPEAEVTPSADSTGDHESFRADCYYLDFDGMNYGAVERSFHIEYFEGEKNIKELEIYPLRFVHDASEILESHQEQGRKFVYWASQAHALYNGWTFVTDPEGVPIMDPEKPWRLMQQRTQYVEGAVIVDFREAINACPHYQPEFTDEEALLYRQSSSKTIDSSHAIIEWSDASRSKQLSELRESVVIDDDCDVLEAHMLLEKDPYMRAGSRICKPPEGEYLALLPPRVFVYALRLRKFVAVDCHRLEAAPVQRDAFRQLQLPEEHKKMIQATVHSHLWKNDIEKTIEDKGEALLQTQDFIRGKGRGLLILLHGEPGVGKTATAETVAQSTGRPLFTIACGSLGTPGSSIEEQLAEIFRLAHLWQCVLLMDEADVLLSARNASTETTASIVSIFLRRLEYYNGILFLTTNRIGKLDPALGSRIHLILHYKRFGLSETTNIFHTNMKRLQKTEEQQHKVSGKPKLFILEQDILKFATDHFNKYPKGKGAWNGRQIRNAFMVAASLARYEAEKPGLAGTDFQPQLRYSHFQEVERLFEDYGRFRAHVLGGDDSRKAFLNEERDDDYEEHEKEEKVSDVVSQLNLARLVYLDQQDRARSGGASSSSGFPSYAQPPPPAQSPPSFQQSMMGHYTQSYLNQTQHQFPAAPQSEIHTFQANQNQGRYNILGSTPQDTLPRGYVGDQHRTVIGGIAQGSTQVPSQLPPDTHE
ncbi:hypothetical protein SLS62_010304 [Diatrype stigma]|uniref:AAA+ ATPase domain-containing protein n=1 Tax=Diatrype stigma TaxID=117547 RepID=A0AAN9UAN4_9PEZI